MRILLPTQIPEAVAILKAGGVIAYPTETCYGLGCDATNAEAVKRLFLIKGRRAGKGFTLSLPANDPFGEKQVLWHPELKMLAEKYWPGPLNIILPIKNTSTIAPECLTDSTISVRRSSHPIAQALVDALGVPLVSTSANISGEPEMYGPKEILEKFNGRKLQPDALIDVGTLPANKPSTIIAMGDEQVVIIRQGAITPELSRS